MGGQPSLRVSRAGLRVWGSLGVGESHKGVATWYRLCAGGGGWVGNVMDRIGERGTFGNQLSVLSQKYQDRDAV